MRLSALAISFASLLTPFVQANDDIGTRDSWFSAGKNAVSERAMQPLNTNTARNIILFVGDGMGISTLTAGRIYAGQEKGNSGEEGLLSFEHFPHTALVKTYNVDAQVADSAGTASALNTGVKTRIGVINTPPTHARSECNDTLANRLPTLAMHAEARGMSTGIVSTTRLTHATPAAVFSAAANRNWENDSSLPADANHSECPDIAQQILGDLGGDGLEVALGGGRGSFVPATQGGWRRDGRDIPAEWLAERSESVFVQNASELAAVDLEKTGSLFGLFSRSHMAYELDRADTNEPSLAEMTEKALSLLSKNEKGFYLMVEGGRIDHAHHAGNAARALGDTKALSEAVSKALTMVDLSDTLILVTADHSHTFTIAGYPRRGNPILGLMRPVRDDEDGNAADGKPYTTLGYANGPGARLDGERITLDDAVVLNKNYMQQSTVPMRSETHGGEDVALFAAGPWAHLARGTIEQNEIFHIMAYALGLGR